MITYEKMSDAFHKLHLGDGTILHAFGAPDEGDPHDHAFDIHVEVLVGGYVECIWDRSTGTYHAEQRNAGDVFSVSAYRVHRIVELLNDEPCITRARYGEPIRKSGFWRWDERGPLHRYWDETEFQRWPREG